MKSDLDKEIERGNKTYCSLRKMETSVLDDDIKRLFEIDPESWQPGRGLQLQLIRILRSIEKRLFNCTNCSS